MHRSKDLNEKVAMRDSHKVKYPQDFFVSFDIANCIGVEWIAWQLEGTRYSVVLSNLGHRSEYNIAWKLDKVSREAKHLIVVLSPNFI